MSERVARELRHLGIRRDELAEDRENACLSARIRLRTQGPATGSWDAHRLAQVFANLIGNAVDHGAGSEVTVDVSGDERAMRATVCNGGPAIPSSVLPHVFDPFRQGPRAEHRRHGLGLGLYISQQIVIAHGGTVDVRSNATSGTTFEVVLPR